MTALLKQRIAIPTLPDVDIIEPSEVEQARTRIDEQTVAQWKLWHLLDALAAMPVCLSSWVYATDYPQAELVMRAWAGEHKDFSVRAHKHGITLERRSTFDAILTVYPERGLNGRP